jgi:predicted PurR-regulated permease PerM
MGRANLGEGKVPGQLSPPAPARTAEPAPPGDAGQARGTAVRAGLAEKPDGERPLHTLRLPASIRVSLIGIFIILLVGALYYGKEILLPIALAFMLTLTLSPVVRYLAKYRIPEVLSALVIVVGVVGGSAAGIYYLSGPVSGWIDGAPQLGRQIRLKIEAMRGPMDAAVTASKQVEEMTSGKDDPTVQKVVVQQPGLLARAAGGAVSLGSTAGITIVLLFFLLSSGRLFYEKLVRILPTLTEKKRAIRIVYTVEEEVSAYLLTITAINVGLGVVIAALMWASGMPNPILWGVMSTALNFIPYVGALVGVCVVAVVALVSFDTPSTALFPPALYFLCTVLEGQFITPALLGRRLEMNTVAVFLAVAIWGWLWGVLGALMAVPILVSLRVMCDHIESLSSLGEFLGGRLPEEPEPTDAEGNPSQPVIHPPASGAAHASRHSRT